MLTNYYLFEIQIDFCPVAVTLQDTTEKCISHKITHCAQNSTQSYTNNKGHITHNEYNAKRK
jgi:hypothetical protein